MSRAQLGMQDGLPARLDRQKHPPAFGGPAHSASIARAKMPRLALSHSHGPGSARGAPGSRGGEDARFDGYPLSARSAPTPKFPATLGETTPRMHAGSYTERLGERDPRRPLALDMRDVPSSRGPAAFARMDRVRTAPTLADFRMSDVQSVSVSSLDKPAELDNWPSSNSAGSKSWLRRLEHFLDVRLQMAADNEAKLLAYHECFAQFTELFKGYRPLLSRIHSAYDAHITSGKSAIIRVTQVEAEMFTLQEHAQETVRKSAQTVTEQLKAMREAVAKMDREKAEALEQLADTRRQLKDAWEEVERRKALNDEIEEKARAYCSGYRWIMKHVVKAEVCVSARSSGASLLPRRSAKLRCKAENEDVSLTGAKRHGCAGKCDIDSKTRKGAVGESLAAEAHSVLHEHCRNRTLQEHTGGRAQTLRRGGGTNKYRARQYAVH